MGPDSAVGPYYDRALVYVVCMTTIVGKYEGPLAHGGSATLQSSALLLVGHTSPPRPRIKYGGVVVGLMEHKNDVSRKLN